MNLTLAQQALKKYFGYDEFRPMQGPIIEAIYEGRDVLVLMPTGGGKSICYQIPAVTMPGVCIVVSPLIALMKDQVEGLRANGISAEYLNSSQSYQEQEAVESALLNGQIELLYVSPEKLLSQSFLPLLKRLPINLIAIDEAHCISAWGHDFRPEYTQMAFVKRQFPSVPVVALTATADKTTRKDIVKQLQLGEPAVFVSSFDRPNLSLQVVPGQKRMERILRFLKSRPQESGIIYCMSRKSTESVAEKLQKQGWKVKAYHAGLSSAQRAQIQEEFINDQTPIICATVAFGMGIDKSNIRWVIHYNMPRNIEGYYQEIGRAGRDGVKSDTMMFYSYADVMFWDQLIEESEYKEVKVAKLQRMKEFAEAQTCRRRVLLSYFGEHLPENCGNCDVCWNPPQEFDGTQLAQMALSAIVRLSRQGHSVGVNLLIDVLRGSKRQEIVQQGLDQIKTYGAGAQHSYQDWQYFMQQLLNLGLIEIAYDENHVVKCTAASRSVLFEGTTVHLVKRDWAVKKQAQATEKAKKQSAKTIAKSELFERLRQLRLQIARREGKPPYLIFSDATLQEMADTLPGTSRDLLDISGIGQAKLASYGSAFLEEIRTFIAENSNTRLRNGQTYIITHHYYNQGLSPNEIAAKRELNELTVYSHLAHIYETGGDIDLLQMVSKQEIKTIVTAAQQQAPPYELKPIFEALNETMPYHKIRLALAYYARHKK